MKTDAPAHDHGPEDPANGVAPPEWRGVGGFVALARLHHVGVGRFVVDAEIGGDGHG